MSPEMPNLRRFLARFWLSDNQMTIILEIIFLLQKIKYAHLIKVHAWLIKAYRDNINDGDMSILDIVAMITPENIHLNSFMFEPILDMSSKKLYEVYQNVKAL